MRHLVLASLLLLGLPARAAPVARCDGAAMPLPKGPLSYALKIDVGRRVSCSQSEETLGELGTLSLEIDAKGAATLDVELFHAKTFSSGPEHGWPRAQPDREDSRNRKRWTGAATRTGDALTVKFSKVASSDERWGSEFHPGKPAPSSLVLACVPGHVSTVPLDPDAKPECVPVLLCRPSEPLLSFKDADVGALAAGLYVDGQLPFASKPGLQLEIERLNSTLRSHVLRAD